MINNIHDLTGFVAYDWLVSLFSVSLPNVQLGLTNGQIIQTNGEWNYRESTDSQND